ncbi:ligand-effect modulator 3 LEM3 family protein, putative [Ichthyophthirius multifiliis]|uniref:Ligand-effect modulator 3 LEM3 family protein, putative n=1 Tax=Ichthyophthirius multifiliis TaxID=5932 RepID=G0R5R7_ICHMU|nr:ligand-effect modulator 3 LEM3 family protein, putative [Ichthyophthirius multifiliis]EGR27197.1 ligand-effect modulator 3 LEM3 family protein, putative [Ichthyophthirius multifiliis]|eukprot:XP_004024081.1 ligand-effect modulator 3 LEM3 family protein, putative [Ichthyophthirius multifiliis]
MSDINKEDKTKFSYAFKQQIMKAWQPVPTINSTIMLFAILSTIFLVFGIVLIILSNQIIEYSVRYDSECGDVKLVNQEDFKNNKLPNNSCKVNFDINENIEGPVFVYYELDNFYQNHRRYVKSKNINQLQGDNVSSSDLSDCEPVLYYKDLRKFKIIDDNLKDNMIANPCGLIAASYFNGYLIYFLLFLFFLIFIDTYVLENKLNNQPVHISNKDIAWPSDKENKFKRNKDYQNIQWLDVEDERFMVWMRTAALPNFRKLWGIIEKGLEKGFYTLNIENNYPVQRFNGKKLFVISTANAFGGKNKFLAISYLVMGFICLLILIVFIVKKISNNKQKAQKSQ